MASKYGTVGTVHHGTSLGFQSLTTPLQRTTLCAHTSKAFFAQGLFETAVDVTHSFSTISTHISSLGALARHSLGLA
jgi:hypothetical protein